MNTYIEASHSLEGHFALPLKPCQFTYLTLVFFRAIFSHLERLSVNNLTHIISFPEVAILIQLDRRD